MSQQVKHKKLVLLGGSGAGKSSLVRRFTDNQFHESIKATIGVEFTTKNVRLEDEIIKFQIWDTSGLERFSSIVQSYTQNSSAAIVVYDVTNAATLDKAQSLVRELMRQENPNIVIALVGNKIDLFGRQVLTEKAKNYAREYGLLYFETSAKESNDIHDVFKAIAETFIEKLQRENEETPDPDSFLNKIRKETKIIWVKFNETPVKIAFNGDDVSDLVEEAKTKLNGLDDFKMDLIEVYKHNSEESLEFGHIVDDSFINKYETPIEIKIKKELNISKDFSNLLETGECHDMIIKVGDDATGSEFKVHSQILGARSTYFRSALSNNQFTKREDGKFYFVKPDITPENFQVILRYIYGGTVSLNEQDVSDTLEVLAAVDGLLLPKELADYLQIYLIKNKAEWMQQHLELVYRISFQSNNLLDLQKFCTDLMTKSPDKIFKSFDFTSLPEKSLISLIERDDLQMKEIEVWEFVLKWGLEKNPTIIPDPAIWSDDDFQIMKNTLKNCLPLIRFFSFSSEDFLHRVLPYKKLLNHQLCEDLLKSYLDPNSEPNDGILLPRQKNIDEIIDSKIVNSNIVSVISRWLDKIDINSKFSYTRELYLPYKFKLLLRGSRDGLTPKKFHKLCDNIFCTVIFIKIKGTEEIIGGYSPIASDDEGDGSGSGSDDDDDDDDNYNYHKLLFKDSFIFSFKNKDNFKDSILSRVKITSEALLNLSCGPSFGKDLFIGVTDNNQTEEYNCNSCKQHSYEKKIRETEDDFLIEDYEVFQIKQIYD